MIKYAELVKNRKLFQSFTGLLIEAFHELLPAFQEAYEDDLAYRDRQKEKPRQRQHGGGRPSQIPELEDKLLFILV